MSKFQIIVLVVFGAFIVIAVGLFSVYRGASGRAVELTVWGDISSYDFHQLLGTQAYTQDQTMVVTYVEKPKESISLEFTEALARGEGPDLIIITQDKLWKERPKLIPIPYENVNARDFQSTFVEEGELFMANEGIYALPVIIDPMVLYYNRDILSSAGQSQPIAYWDQIYPAAQNLSKRDAAGNLTQSIIALGEARNVPNSKDILSLLMLQAGTPLTAMVGSELRSQIAARFDFPISPGESAFDFYTQFSNPTRSYYSWNRSLVDAQTHFTSGDTAYYLGFASEFRVLKNKNPTLNFGVTLVPQSRVGGRTTTFGRIYGVAIARGASSPSAALALAKKLSSRESIEVLSQSMLLPPAHRDMLSERPTDAVLSVFYDAAIQARGWLDPDPVATKAIFDEAVESITSGRARTAEAVAKASREIDNLIR